MPLAHDVTGNGPAVLLLHSTATDRRMWDPQVPALSAAGYRVVRCDLRGYGESPIPPGVVWDDAADVAELLDIIGAEQTAVIGASGGGRVALEVAARCPHRVTALALLCTALRGHEPSAVLRAFGEQEDALLEAGDVAGATELNVELWLGPEAGDQERASVRLMQRNAFEMQLAAEQEAAEQDEGDAAPAEFDLAAITAPTLLFSGANDLIDFREIAVHLASRLPKARHVELAWAGHLPSLERPDLMNPLLLDFLANPN